MYFNRLLVCATVFLWAGVGGQTTGTDTAAATPATAVGDWQDGRATFYGNEYWYWSIHEGSCDYGYQCDNEGTGWDVAALPDTHPDFRLGACGTCYEVKCHGVTFEDIHGNVLDRTNICYNSEASVVVRVVDACPCNDVNNYYSNNRWCCGDIDHLDLSIWAFEKLADPKWGVMGLQYRPVACDHKPATAAPPLEVPYAGVPPPSEDYCPSGRWEEIDSRVFDRSQDYQQAGLIYTDTLQNYWQFSNWNSESYEMVGSGINGGSAVCGKLFPGGAISFVAPEGALKSWVSLEFFIRGNDNIIPNIDINLAGDEGSCTGQNIYSLKASGTMPGGYTRYVVYLAKFDQAVSDVVVAFASSFKGCGQLDVSQIKRIAFLNNQPVEQTLCVDQVALLG
eukprot:TRINITY_DN107_c1_g1_i1.p2 TRINITY_DN107_c1_g1~~TRINITY_DN107_c1_g1_i1.p2  ORF type:complete len:394 (-),score=54.81 TRINITY_DN107_c1_g1_i1:3929-5110(-)